MKILIIQLRRIGDILLTTPAVSFLRKKFPEAQIDFLCESMGLEVLKNNPYLNDILIYDKNKPLEQIRIVRQKKYDVIFDFLNNPRTSYLSALSGAKETVGFNSSFRSFLYKKRIPVPKAPEYVPKRKIRMIQEWLGETEQTTDPLTPQLFLINEDEKFALDWMKKENLTSKSFTILVPAHRHPIRAWKGSGFREVGLDLVDRRKEKVFLAWGPGEEDVIAKVRQGIESKLPILPPTHLRQMAAIFKEAKLVVTNDSGAMHLAVAVKVPTVTIYGPTRPIDWNPSLSGDVEAGRIHKVINLIELDCLGCHLSVCPIGHLCMENLNEKKVLEKVDQLLEEN
ncbi:MAG: glycosyltransferase family 9 protein [Elusimicrobiota bacterium]